MLLFLTMKLKTLLIVCLLMCCNAASAQELKEQTPIDFSVSSGFGYSFQKYTGFNAVVDFLAEKIVQSIIKLETKAKDLDVNLEIYSGVNLLQKKAKALNIAASELLVKKIPVSYFNFQTLDPIYFKKVKLKSGKKRNRVVFPLRITSQIKVNLNDISDILNNLPKWKEVLGEVDLPVPPFGYTKIAVTNLKIDVNEAGLIYVSSSFKSLINEKSEPLNVDLRGKLILKDKKLLIENLQSEVKDIFADDTEIGKAFSDMLEDLINPVIKFTKYEKNGLKIDNIEMLFEQGKLGLNFSLTLHPLQ